MSKPDDGLTYCAELVREHEPGRYLATLFAPAPDRPALFALYAFDHELTKVHRIVTEPMAGLIRFQWWRDALDAISGGKPAPSHPVVHALQQEWRSIGPSQPLLDAAIDTRERELDEAPLDSKQTFERHLQATSAGPILAALAILSASDPKTHEIGLHAGLAIGLTDLLCEIDQRRERACLLPEDLLSALGMSNAAIQEASSPRDLEPLARGLADDAHHHLRQARQLGGSVSRQALPALLPLALVGGRLKGLRAMGAKSPGKPQSLAARRLLACWVLGRF
ncbi:MAG: squalene/phytoene synthase family protein [Pseudomonadota bacterium]